MSVISMNNESDYRDIDNYNDDNNTNNTTSIFFK